MPFWSTRPGLVRQALNNSARTTFATLLSLLLARSLGLAEFYWAPVSTIVIMLSPVNPTTVAWQRFAGTALGAALGGLLGTFFHANWMIYGGGIFFCGMFCSLLRLDWAYRFAAITLTIVVLVAHERPPWVVAFHRFIEVSLGVAVALIVARIWPASGESKG